MNNNLINNLMSDAQVADEKFLVLINNLLASGEIPDLFAEDEVGENKLPKYRFFVAALCQLGFIFRQHCECCEE